MQILPSLMQKHKMNSETATATYLTLEHRLIAVEYMNTFIIKLEINLKRCRYNYL